MRRLWLCRVCGCFVCPLHWFAFGVGPICLTSVACGGFAIFFLCFGASRRCWSFASSVAVVSRFLKFGPRLVLVLVAPHGVGFGLLRFALALVLCAVVPFLLLSPFGAWYWFPQAKSGKFALYTIRV